MIYEYTQKNLLDMPHRYMYTPYGGADFLRAFFEDRRTFIPPQKRPALSAIGSVIEAAADRKGEASGDTDERLIASARELLSGKDRSEFVDRAIRSFEVGRKLYDAYDANGKPLDGAGSDDLRLYALLAVCCGLDCAARQNLKSLNSLLKLCDLLSSCSERICRDETLTRLSSCAVALEDAAVRACMESQGVRV